MVIRDSHLNSLVLPYKKQTMVVLCAVREALAEVRLTQPHSGGAPSRSLRSGTLRSRGMLRDVHPISGKVTLSRPTHLPLTRAVGRLLGYSRGLLKKFELQV
jgi:hypothetical protein